MTVRNRLGATVALAAFAVAGCTSPTTGTAEPSATTEPGTSVSIPPRPKDLSIASVDACTLLTDAQMTQLKIYRKAPGPADPQSGPQTSCSYQVNDPVAHTISVLPETKIGIDTWLKGGGFTKSRLVSVSSYPAAQTIYIGDNFDAPTGVMCETQVSTANGQDLSAAVGPHDKDLSMTQMCDLSKQVATLALATLQANQ